MTKLLLPLLALVTLCGCAPTAREPDDLALVRVLGVDGAEPVVLTAVCGKDGEQQDQRGGAEGETFAIARSALPWSGEGQELSLTGVTWLVIGGNVDLPAVLLSVLEDADLGASAFVWVADEEARIVLESCANPAADLRLFELQGVCAPTAAQAAAALYTEGRVVLPRLGVRDGRLEHKGEIIWQMEL